MSAIYPGIKTKLWQWALNGGAPSNSRLMVAMTGNGFAFNPNHNTIGQAGGLVSPEHQLAGVTAVGGLLNAEDLVVEGLELGVYVTGVLVFLRWGSNTQLVCWINESTEIDFPHQMLVPSFPIQWNSQGIALV